jgi:hypothetical protein
MKVPYHLLGCCIVALILYSGSVQAADIAKDLANRLSTAEAEQFQGLMAELDELPLDVFPSLFTELYTTGHVTDEGTSILAGFVLKAYTKRVGERDIAERMLTILKDKDAPNALKRDMCRGIQGWTGSRSVESMLSALDGIATPEQDTWLYIQYAASRLLRSAHSKAKREGNQQAEQRLVTLSEGQLSRIMNNLLEHGAGDEVFESWTGKILASYRKIAHGTFDDALMKGLSAVDMSPSKQLGLLDLVCGYGEQNPVIVDHVQKIKDNAHREGKSLSDEDGKKAEKLLNQHRKQ